MYPEETACENKILDLTRQEDEWEEQEGPDYSCDHCEIPMQKAEEDLSSATDGRVIIKRGSYFCSQCGIVWRHSLGLAGPTTATGNKVTRKDWTKNTKA
jgi:hypothetical protein